MQYLEIRAEEDAKRKNFEIYVTDMLYILSTLEARQVGAELNVIRYGDMIDNKANEPQRSSDDVINSISSTLDFLGKEKEE